MTPRKKILIFADGVSTAHTTRMEVLASQIDQNFFDIHFATTKEYFNLLSLQEAGIPLYPITSISNQFFNDKLFEAKCPWSAQVLDNQVKEDTDLIDRVQPNLVIGDTRLSLIVSCHQKNIPYYNTVHYHWSSLYQRPKSLVPYIKLVKIFGRTIAQLFAQHVTPFILKSQVRPINDWLSFHHMKPLKSLNDFYSQGDFLLFPDLEELFKDQTHPKNSYFINPLIWKSKKIKWPSHWGKLDLEKKYAYVAMGSTGKNDLLPQIIQVLNKHNYEALLSGSHNPLVNLSHLKVQSADFLPTDEVLQHCSFAIGNGGTGSTYHFLNYGIPFISLPTNFDQYLNVDLLKKLQISEYIDQDQFTENSLSEKILLVSNSEVFNANIETIKKIIQIAENKNKINEILKSNLR